MSLQALADLRRRGSRPDAPIVALVGQKPPSWADDWRHLHLDSTVRLADMDFRPLIGLWVAVVMNRQLPDLALRLLQSMEAVKAKPYGLVLPDGSVHMGILDPTDAHINNLRLTWERYQ